MKRYDQKPEEVKIEETKPEKKEKAKKKG